MANVKVIAIGAVAVGAAAAVAVLAMGKKDSAPKSDKPAKEAKGAKSAPAKKYTSQPGLMTLTTVMHCPEGEKFMVNVNLDNIAGATLKDATFHGPAGKNGDMKDGTATVRVGNGEEIVIIDIPEYTDFSVEVVPVEAKEYIVEYDSQKGTLSAAETTVNITMSK